MTTSINLKEIRTALRGMKNSKAVGPDEIPVEVWTCLGEYGVQVLNKRFNCVTIREEIPRPWRQSILGPIFSGKGDIPMPGVGLMVRVVGLGSWDPEFKSHSAVELISGGVESACHPSEVGRMSASLLASCVGVASRPGLCPIAKETALAAPTLCTEYGPDGWMDDPRMQKRTRN